MFKGEFVLQKKKKLFDNIYEYQLMLPDSFDFNPGQFISVDVGRGIRRSYSILSAENRILKLVIDLSPGGPGSMFFKNIREGENIRFMGPLGRFSLSGTNKDKVFIATGTGLVPFVSMIKSLVKDNFDGNIQLFFGTKYLGESESYYYLDYEEKNSDNFSIYRCITREDFLEENKFLFKGRVTEALPVKIKDLSNKEFYVCGVNEMIDDVMSVLISLGVDASQIYHEKYG
jgi:NAD(P)H-flavin reductase